MTVLRLPNLARDSSCLRRRRQHTDGVAARAGFAGAWRHSALRADITDTLRGLKAKHVLVVADSCYSGTLTRSIGVQALDNADAAALARTRARTVMTSGGQEPVSDVGGDFLFVHR